MSHEHSRWSGTLGYRFLDRIVRPLKKAEAVTIHSEPDPGRGLGARREGRVLAQAHGRRLLPRLRLHVPRGHSRTTRTTRRTRGSSPSSTRRRGAGSSARRPRSAAPSSSTGRRSAWSASSRTCRSTGRSRSRTSGCRSRPRSRTRTSRGSWASFFATILARTPADFDAHPGGRRDEPSARRAAEALQDVRVRGGHAVRVPGARPDARVADGGARRVVRRGPRGPRASLHAAAGGQPREPEREPHARARLRDRRAQGVRGVVADARRAVPRRERRPVPRRRSARLGRAPRLVLAGIGVLGPDPVRRLPPERPHLPRGLRGDRRVRPPVGRSIPRGRCRASIPSRRSGGCRR